MREELLALRGRLFLATGLGLGVGSTMACLEHAPIDECFERAMEEVDDNVEVIRFYIEPGDSCPGEGSKEVKEEAKLHGTCELTGVETELRYIACGPKSAVSYCEYVAVYAEPTPPCGVVGRPFMVGGEPRRASACERAAWSDARDRLVSQCDVPTEPKLRRALARYWTEAALAEHASIAAFARFAIQLLRLGAPPELLRDCHAAMADETRHARLAFGLASRFGGQTIGPTGLDLDSCLDIDTDIDIEALLDDVVVEGCLGETRAAFEARVAATHCADPALAAVLLQIAQDEERHAALAWRFVAWLLRARPDSRGALERALERGLARAPVADMGVGVDGGAGMGLLDDGLRRSIDARVRAVIVAPLGRSLLQPTSEAVARS